MPAHVLLVHLIVVLVPLTALLALLSALWPAARQRLIWLTVALALFTAVVTPLTASAGEWLEHRVGRSAVLHTHTELGDTMAYFSVALLIAVGLLAFIHYRQARTGATSGLARGLVVTLVVLASVAASVQIYRIGDSGAQATWGDRTGVAADDSSD
nr:DUF2231 domain-containing protein [Mycolicibacterium fortuitum]